MCLTHESCVMCLTHCDMCLTHDSCVWHMTHVSDTSLSHRDWYGVASMNRLLKIIGLFCRISSLFNRALLQKRPIILRSLLSVATPYVRHNTCLTYCDMCVCVVMCMCVSPTSSRLSSRLCLNDVTSFRQRHIICVSPTCVSRIHLYGCEPYKKETIFCKKDVCVSHMCLTHIFRQRRDVSDTSLWGAYD